MGCSNCKKKKSIKEQHSIKQNVANSPTTKKQNNGSKSSTQNIIDLDKMITWIVILWFLLGGYGLYSIIKDAIKIFT